MGAAASRPPGSTRDPEVICVGFQRTGTLSMALAFEKLGYGPVSHGGSQLLGADDAYMRQMHHMYQVLDDRPALLKAVHAATCGFGALSDAPYNMFVEEMAELYPLAKFVYLEREQTAWWRSMEPVVASVTAKWLRYYLCFAPGWRWVTVIGDGFSRRYKMLGITAYESSMLAEHKAYVMRSVPSDRLLCMSVKDGWAPLCNFLKKDVPNEPFPHANEAEAVAKVMPRVMGKVLLMWIGVVSSLGLAVYAGNSLLRAA